MTKIEPRFSLRYADSYPNSFREFYSFILSNPSSESIPSGQFFSPKTTYFISTYGKSKVATASNPLTMIIVAFGTDKFSSVKWTKNYNPESMPQTWASEPLKRVWRIMFMVLVATKATEPPVDTAFSCFSLFEEIKGDNGISIDFYLYCSWNSFKATFVIKW